MTPPRKKPDQSANRNLGISRGLRTLELLAATPKGLRVTDVASSLGVNKAIAFRILMSLVGAEYAHQDPETQRYQASFRLAALGLQQLERAGLGEWAQEPLDRLARQTQELVRLAVVEGSSLRWIAKAQGSNSTLIIDPAAGADVVLHATATGKAWLSSLDPAEAREILLERGLGRQTKHTVTDLADALREIDEARRTGYAMVLEEMDPGINAIAAPISDEEHGRSAVGTVSIAGPAVRMTPAALEGVAGPLLATARELSTRWAIYRHQLSAV